MGALKEAFTTLDIDIDPELWEYLLFVVYSKSESLDKMRYSALFEILDGRVSVGSTEGAQRKRPESSSPEKLKARNKDKFSGEKGSVEEPEKK